MREKILIALFCFCFGFCTPSWAGGCYDKLIGQEFTATTGEKFIPLKNNNWKCQPLALIYAGMFSPKGFSVAVQFNNGGINLFYMYDPQNPGNKLDILGYSFEVIKVTPENLKVKYLGEKKKKK